MVVLAKSETVVDLIDQVDKIPLYTHLDVDYMVYFEAVSIVVAVDHSTSSTEIIVSLLGLVSSPPPFATITVLIGL